VCAAAAAGGQVAAQSAWAGLAAGFLHTLCGPDHLAVSAAATEPEAWAALGCCDATRTPRGPVLRLTPHCVLSLQQALTPLTIGRGRAAASALGALWGFGHSTGQLILGLVFVLLKVSGGRRAVWWHRQPPPPPTPDSALSSSSSSSRLSVRAMCVTA
jgi:hypothetical protein